MTIEKYTPSFQTRVDGWLLACFGEEIARSLTGRNHRFFEEATELVQACGMAAAEAHQLVDYVYGRPAGDPHQEVGGVMVTLAALCLARRLDMHDAGESELTRVWENVAKIRQKEAAREKDSPLPGASAPPHAALLTEDQDHEAFYEAYDQHTKLTGHKPTPFDVWLMARGRMTPAGRRPDSAPSLLRLDRFNADMDGEMNIYPGGQWVRFDAVAELLTPPLGPAGWITKDGGLSWQNPAPHAAAPFNPSPSRTLHVSTTGVVEASPINKLAEELSVGDGKDAVDLLADRELADAFRGDDANLISCIVAILALDRKDALVPHGIGNHARGLLAAAGARMRANQRPKVP